MILFQLDSARWINLQFLVSAHWDQKREIWQLHLANGQQFDVPADKVSALKQVLVPYMV